MHSCALDRTRTTRAAGRLFEAIAERVSPDEIISKIIGELGKGERVAPVENIPLPEAALAADTPDMSEEEKSEGKKKRGLFGRK